MNDRRAQVDSAAPEASVSPSALSLPPASSDQRFAATAAYAPGDTVETPVEPSAAGPHFGRYRLLRLLGQGGMGEVHLAYDTMLCREVALKIPKFADDNPVHRERFGREARSAALLTHPSICQVYDVGEIDGKPYLTMAFIEGPSLASWLRKHGPLEPHDAARLVQAIALAMAHAHEQGVVHRDLKPANILLAGSRRQESGIRRRESGARPSQSGSKTQAGEPAGRAQTSDAALPTADCFSPIVMDFGLAFRFDAQTSERLTEAGMIIGTPSYMPPEQVNGQPRGPAADVSSLGVVLYELVTGQVPFEGPLGKLLAQIQSAEPAPPSQVRDDIDRGLDWLCLKALAKAPADRFAGMSELAEALDDYVRGKITLTHLAAPTMAFRPPPRRRWATALGGLGLVAAAVAATVLLMRRNAPEEPPAPPPPDPQQVDITRQFDALAKPILKIEAEVSPEKPMHLSRAALPRKLFEKVEVKETRFHSGPLYWIITGSGPGHTLDMTDQPGQAGQVQFTEGDITVTGFYLLFIGKMTDSAHVYLKGGPGYSVLAPMNGGPGSSHVEFDGTHLLQPKIENATVAAADVTPYERTTLRNRHLTMKVNWSYTATKYVIFTHPTIKIVPGNHEERRAQMPEIYDLIEFDRDRQSKAAMVKNAEVQRALVEAQNR